MGSLTSRPKISTTQSTSVQPSASAETVTTVTEASPEETAKTRAENVLRRSRSTIGTVLTSFKGILGENNAIPQRKSLLGE
jgi:hypothetical protein